MEEKVYISKEEYDKLLEDHNFLACLRAAGVDNWQGYEDAIDMMISEYEV